VSRFPFIAQRLFNTPLAVHPRRIEVVIGALAERLGIASMTRLNGDVVILKPGAWRDDDDDFDRPGTVADYGYDLIGGVAVIPVAGTLVQKLASIRPYSGMSGYDSIRAAFNAALDDPAAKGIVFEVDSGGGEVAGCFDLVDEIYAARSVKPLIAILTEDAFSAAYAIASATSKIIVPRTGAVGSIGVICAHVDFSKALSGAGIAVTFISYGARKTDGAPEKPLSDEALAVFQADVDTMGELFVETVARNRGLSADQVRATEAGTFLGAKGVEAGLACAVMSPDAAFRELIASLA
jgi:signal peptide peptidase SppA